MLGAFFVKKTKKNQTPGPPLPMFSCASSLPLRIEGEHILRLTPTASGINIVGGKASIDGTNVLVKFVDRDAALAQCAIDSIKPLFGFERIGCSAAVLASPFTNKGRTWKTNTSMLLMKWIDGLENAKDCSKRLCGSTSGVEFCARDGPLFVSWLEVICLRLLVCGARDPWSNTAWNESTQQFVSFDEGTAFSNSMAPDNWSYLDGKIKLKAEYRKRLFLDGGQIVVNAASRWKSIDHELLRSTLSVFYPPDRCNELVIYVCRNVVALEQNFARLCNASCAIQSISLRLTNPPYNERAYNQQRFLGNYNVSEAKSWLQKSARRGLSDQCRFSAMLMLASQNITNLVHRLITMCVEDCMNACLVVNICQKWQMIKQIQESVPWREMRDLTQVRQLIADMANQISEVPSSRVADHVGAIFFREDHPFVGGTPAFDCPIVACDRDVAYTEFVSRVHRCAQGEWSIELEREMLFIAGGLWVPRGDVKREKPLELLRLISTTVKPNSPAILSAALSCLLLMMEEIHGANPMRGKLNLIAGIIMFARSPPSMVDAAYSLDWAEVQPNLHPDVAREYQLFEEGSLRLAVPEWVHDMHCGKREEKSSFLERESKLRCTELSQKIHIMKMV